MPPVWAHSAHLQQRAGALCGRATGGEHPGSIAAANPRLRPSSPLTAAKRSPRPDSRATKVVTGAPWGGGSGQNSKADRANEIDALLQRPEQQPAGAGGGSRGQRERQLAGFILRRVPNHHYLR